MRPVRIEGGLNNEVFGYDDPLHGRVCRKVFKQDGREREKREWWALQTLSRCGADFAPKPISAQGAEIVMTWVEGRPMNGWQLSAQQLDALYQVLAELYAIPIDADVAPISGMPSAVVDRVRRLVAERSDESEALNAIRRWLDGDEPRALTEMTLTTFGRGDPNLANCLWHDGKISLIDWEYAGRTSRAYELADHVEHIQARATNWTTFIERFGFSDEERRHHLLSRRLLAAYWLLLLWPGTRGHALNPTGTFEAQERRILELLNA